MQICEICGYFSRHGTRSSKASTPLAPMPLWYRWLFRRPIAWVTTINVDGAINAAPFSFFNVLGSKPPIVGICPGIAKTVCQRIPLGTFASRMSLSSILLMKRSQSR